MAETNIGAQGAEFLPNVRLEIRKHTTYVKLIDDSITSPLYGKIEQGDSDSGGYDERNYRNSIMRHSELFEHMRALRSNIASTASFYDDKDSEIKGDKEPGTAEQYTDGYFETDGNIKLIRMGTGNEIEVHGDGTAVWRTPDPLSPEIHFEKGKRIADAVFPHLDFLIKLGADVTFPQKNCVTTELADNLTEKGGELVIEYIIELGGLEAENTRLSVKVFPYPENLPCENMQECFEI